MQYLTKVLEPVKATQLPGPIHLYMTCMLQNGERGLCSTLSYGQFRPKARDWRGLDVCVDRPLWV